MNSFLESTDQLANLRNPNSYTPQNENKWEWGYLRRKCRNLELEQFYDSYMQRLRKSYLSLFIAIDAIMVLIHCTLLLTTATSMENTYIDVSVYLVSTAIVFGILSVNFNKRYTHRRSWMYFSSWTSVAIMVLVDLCVPIFHAFSERDILRPAYYSFILYAIYIFLPLPENTHAIILGSAVTISYIVNFGFLTFRRSMGNQPQLDYIKLIAELLFMVCINLLGVYFRMMKEIAIRVTFLDRRQCVEENLLLHYARDQEKNLLLSIIPAQIANKIEQDVKVRIEHLKLRNEGRASLREPRNPSPNVTKRWRQPDTEKLFIEPHDDVSILYADVVNYTYLTTTLDVKTLVETIHDLFVKFDLASEEFNVLRIKFLGDCYYCVAGVPIPNPRHAKSCVDLGLRMIKDIRDVRAKRKLNIDMRIGVHSGNILSGVIGASKWQFDIWSKDVDIANRLEQTGQSGRVHVSDETLKLLDGEYIFEEGTMAAKADPVLRKNNVHTYLIKPPKNTLTTDISRVALGVRRRLEQQKPDLSTNFLQTSIVQYNQIRTQATLEMSRELDKMPISRLQFRKYLFGKKKRLTQDEMEEQMFRNNISSMFLFFKDWRWEYLYMQEPDCLLKYSIAFSYIVFLSIVAIQGMNAHQQESFWTLSIGAFVLFTICLVMSWFKKMWTLLISDSESVRPRSLINLYLYRYSERMESNLWVRLLIYIAMEAIFSVLTFMQLTHCNLEPDDIVASNACVNTWAVTECVVLILVIGFLFTRIPFVVKLACGFSIVVAFTVYAGFIYADVFEVSATTNIGFHPQLAHLLLVFLTFAIFHLMDRQTEFISKVDYNWKRQLQKKQEDATFTNETIKILINNILPTHVADIYMSKQMKNELYYEEYNNVAVMFATIRNYDTEQVGLRVLNEIICDFDKVLNSCKGPLKIEKIKVAGWTYMAACGLDVEHVAAQPQFRNSSLLPNMRRSHYNDSKQPSYSAQKLAVAALSAPQASMDGVETRTRSSNQYEGHVSASAVQQRRISNPLQNSVVFVMAQFALELMRTMHSFNIENLQCEVDGKDCGMLRIGISNGPVMAGVVGSYKPHYDIWGNAVNMASRMDSTGTPGCIQVTENTARILHKFNIKCTKRGLTFVKGRGRIPTFFVDTDSDMNFVQVAPSPPEGAAATPSHELSESDVAFDETADSQSRKNSLMSQLSSPSTSGSSASQTDSPSVVSLQDVIDERQEAADAAAGDDQSMYSPDMFKPLAFADHHGHFIKNFHKTHRES